MKITITLLLLITVAATNGQIPTVAETVKNYNIAQKRLLVIGVFQSANCLTQNNLDQDSMMAIACRATNMPFLLPYKECFPDETDDPATCLINAGKLVEAIRSVSQANGRMRIQGLLEISMWYLHQNGTSRNDLDSASHYLQLALSKSNTAANRDWKISCLFQSAEINYQRGDFQLSSILFKKAAKSCIQQGKMQMAALTYMRIGDLLVHGDTKRNYYNQSFRIFESLGLVEKQIELLWKISLCNMDQHLNLAERDLRQVINLAGRIGFRHTFYAQNHLSYILTDKGDYAGAMEFARGALQNMRWSGLSVFEGTCYMRMGVAYASLGETDQSVKWFKLAINIGTKENHLFWYKSVPLLTRIIAFEINKPALALSLIDSLKTLFPPITVWEQLQLLSCVGICNNLLNESTLADNYFKQLSALAKTNPQADPYGEMFLDYLMIAQFYVARNNLATARKFFKLAILREKRNMEGLYLKYSVSYKMDSLETNYKSALQNHIKYKIYYDSFVNTGRKKRMQQLVKSYAGEAMNKRAKSLREKGMIQLHEMTQNKLIAFRVFIGVSLIIAIILGVLINDSLKERSNLPEKKENLELQRLLHEKEWLLKEVHHRVKNNLRTVIGLLESQAAYLDNDALEAVQKSQHRIYSISLIHQKLSQSQDVDTIDISIFLPEFISYLERSFGTHERIEFQLIADKIILGLSQAIPVALIVNEAVTNSIKHAFPGKQKGIVDVSIRRNADYISLLIADDGIGMEESLKHRV